MKKFATSLAALALIAGASVASAASAQRTGAAIGDSEALSSTVLILGAFTVVAAGIVVAAETNENETPTSP